jgi:tetratricopeptide (TPR) repeat protein
MCKARAEERRALRSAMTPRCRFLQATALLPLAAAIALLACRADEGRREYFAALEAAKHGAPVAVSLAHVERAIRHAPDRAPYYELRADYRRALGDLAGAEADYGRAIDLRDRPYLHFARANVIALRGDPARALADYDLAIAREAWNVQFYRGRALARAAAGRGAEALADAEHLLAQTPQQAESWHARGVARLAVGRPQDALGDLDRAIAEQPELLYAYADRARAREQLGDTAGAAADRARAAEARASGCGACADPYH